jgi:hypothetical protein
LATKLNFGYKDIIEMKVSLIKIYLDKALEIMEEEQKELEDLRSDFEIEE